MTTEQGGAGAANPSVKIIPPSIGRVVWYRPNETDHLGSDQPIAALVTYVHGDRMVNIVAFTPEGTPVGKTSVKLLQPGDGIGNGTSYCEWMPYQIGQAGKAEAAEKKLADAGGAGAAAGKAG